MHKIKGLFFVMIITAVLTIIPESVYAVDASQEQIQAQQLALLGAQLQAQHQLQTQIQEQQLALLAAQLKVQQEAAQQAQQLADQQAKQQALLKSVESAGQTYIDVSIDNQTLVYYVNGFPVLSTACVTGSPGRDTPRGIFTINSLVPGKYLKGPTWNVWVNRWMRFAGNCGIHDATWRNSFGGNIYKSNGSHGCVNIPRDQAYQLYDMVGLGTVVIVH